MSENMAYLPAEALLRMLARKPWKGVSPTALAAMPREKATARYPKAMGMPAFIPLRKACFFVIAPWSVIAP